MRKPVFALLLMLSGVWSARAEAETAPVRITSVKCAIKLVPTISLQLAFSHATKTPLTPVVTFENGVVLKQLDALPRKAKKANVMVRVLNSSYFAVKYQVQLQDPATGQTVATLPFVCPAK